MDEFSTVLRPMISNTCGGGAKRKRLAGEILASQAKRGALEPARATEALRLIRGEAGRAEEATFGRILRRGARGVIVRSRARGFSRGGL